MVPVFCNPHRIPFAHIPIVQGIMDGLLIEGVIDVSDSSYSFPGFLVTKKNGEHRWVVDYRELNKITVTQNFPMPRVDDILDSLTGSIILQA